MEMNIIKGILLILFFTAISIPGVSQTVDSLDLTLQKVPEIRYPAADRMEEFRADDEFNYLEQAPGKSLWDRFWAYIKGILSQLFTAENGSFLSSLVKVIIYSIVTATVVYLIYKLVIMRYSKALGENNNDSLHSTINEENIHSLDFDGLIREAIDNANYRLAIRLRYLQTLKLLADRGIIDWEPYKTNHDYSYEINELSQRHAFDKISYYFDYAWYGDFSVEKYHYERVGEIYEELSREP
jgi:hypothetical protein